MKGDNMPTGVYLRKPGLSGLKSSTENRAEYIRALWKNNPASKDLANKRVGTYYRRLRARVIQHLGGKCNSAECSWINEDGTKGCSVSSCLQVDHVNGGGVKEIKSLSPSA